MRWFIYLLFVSSQKINKKMAKIHFCHSFYFYGIRFSFRWQCRFHNLFMLLPKLNFFYDNVQKTMTKSKQKKIDSVSSIKYFLNIIIKHSSIFEIKINNFNPLPPVFNFLNFYPTTPLLILFLNFFTFVTKTTQLLYTKRIFVLIKN